MKFSIKKVLLICLKLAFSGFIIYHLVVKFGHEFTLITVKLNWFYLIVAALLFFISQVVSIWRWQVCCEKLQLISPKDSGRYPLLDSYLSRIYLIGFFWNNFLPGSFGGDLVRAYLIKKHNHNLKWVDCAGSVFIDRVFGLLTLCWMGLLSGLFIKAQINHHLLSPSTDALKLINSIILGMGIACALSTTVIAILPLLSCFLPSLPADEDNRDENNGLTEKLIVKVVELVEALKKITRDKLATLQFLMSSAVIQVLVTFCLLSIARGLNLKIPGFLLWALNPLTTFASLLAPSINGLGVREGINAYYFKVFGYSGADGIMFSACWLICLLITGLPGAYFLLTQKEKMNAVNNESQTEAKDICYRHSLDTDLMD